MRLYVAGPMSGYPDFNYPAFEEARQYLEAAGYEVLSPIDLEKVNPTPGSHQPWGWYMRGALRMVLDAEGVALLDDWSASRGACAEVNLAHTLQIPALPIAVWLQHHA